MAPLGRVIVFGPVPLYVAYTSFVNRTMLLNCQPSCCTYVVPDEDAFAEIDSDIVMDLLNTDEDYAALSDRMDKLKTQYPVIDKMNEDSGEIRMTAEEHRAYVDYLNLARQMEDMERQHIYFCGSVDAVAYFKNQSELTQTTRKLRAVFYYAAYSKA